MKKFLSLLILLVVISCSKDKENNDENKMKITFMT